VNPPSEPSTSSANGNLLVRSVSNNDSCWIENFSVPWDNLPAKLLNILKANKRPSKDDKLAIVRFIVDEIKKFSPNLTLDQTKQIAKKIVKSYPNTFEDRDKLGCGYFTLAKHLKTRVEYLNRGSMVARLRQVKKSISSDSEVAHESSTTSRSSLQYGCVNWQPQSFPDNENGETLKLKMTGLQELARSQGVSMSARKDIHRIDRDMSATYIVQRQLINTHPPVAVQVIQEQWPFLFVDRWLFRHFEQLVGKPPYSVLREAVASKGDRIIRYFDMRGNSAEKAFVHQHRQNSIDADDEEHTLVIAAVLHLVMHHFQEDEGALFIIADVSACWKIYI
jgi:hypothetical protein